MRGHTRHTTDARPLWRLNRTLHKILQGHLFDTSSLQQWKFLRAPWRWRQKFFSKHYCLYTNLPGVIYHIIGIFIDNYVHFGKEPPPAFRPDSYCAQYDSFQARSQKCAKRLSASSCLSVRPSVRIDQPGFRWSDFIEIWYLRIFRKFVQEIHVSLKSDKNKGYFTCIPTYIYNNVT